MTAVGLVTAKEGRVAQMAMVVKAVKAVLEKEVCMEGQAMVIMAVAVATMAASMVKEETMAAAAAAAATGTQAARLPAHRSGSSVHLRSSTCGSSRGMYG